MSGEGVCVVELSSGFAATLRGEHERGDCPRCPHPPHPEPASLLRVPLAWEVEDPPPRPQAEPEKPSPLPVVIRAGARKRAPRAVPGDENTSGSDAWVSARLRELRRQAETQLRALRARARESRA